MADIALNEDLTLALPMRLIDGVELVVQRLRVALNTHRGEWLLDETVGIPYRDWAQVSPVPTRAVEARLRDVILGTPGVLRLDDFSVTFSSATETFTAVGTVVVDTDDPNTPIQVSLDPIRGAVRVRSSTR